MIFIVQPTLSDKVKVQLYFSFHLLEQANAMVNLCYPALYSIDAFAYISHNIHQIYFIGVVF